MCADIPPRPPLHAQMIPTHRYGCARDVPPITGRIFGLLAHLGHCSAHVSSPSYSLITPKALPTDPQTPPTPVHTHSVLSPRVSPHHAQLTDLPHTHTDTGIWALNEFWMNLEV